MKKILELTSVGICISLLVLPFWVYPIVLYIVAGIAFISLGFAALTLTIQSLVYKDWTESAHIVALTVVLITSGYWVGQWLNLGLLITGGDAGCWEGVWSLIGGTCIMALLAGLIAMIRALIKGEEKVKVMIRCWIFKAVVAIVMSAVLYFTFCR